MKKYSGRTTTAIIEYLPGTVLLVKRDTYPFKGYWALPGGRVDLGETVEQTVVREVKEETGFEVEIVRKIGEYHEQGIREVEYDYYPACFLVRVLGGKLKRQQAEIQEIKLFKFEDVPPNLAFVHNAMIEDYLAQRNAEIEK